MATVSPTRFESRAFGLFFIGSAFLFFWTLSPIWVPVFLGVLLAVVASPLDQWLERWLGAYPRLLAASITLITLALGVGIIAFVGFVVVRELILFLSDNGQDVASQALAWVHSARAESLLGRFGMSSAQAITAARSYATSIASQLAGILSGILAVTSHGLLLVLFIPLTSYYLLLDRRTLSQLLIRLMPLPPSETKALMAEFRRVSVGMLLGTGATAIFQGFAGGLGFKIFGVSRPLVWGALTAVSSLVPTVGTALVWFPAAAILFFTGHVGRGIGLLIYWAVVIVGVADYVLRPWLLRDRMRLHPLLVFIALFGGLEAFGLIGLLLGPLFVALFVAMVRIYDRDYRPTRPGSPTTYHQG